MREATVSAMAVALVLAAPAMAQAETLADALAWAYAANPQLQGQRAQLRALDETYVQARSSLGPTLGLGVTAQYSKQQETTFGFRQTVEANQLQPQIELQQQIYTGGRTTAAMNSAMESIRSGRESLRRAEADIMLAVVSAYASVLRDENILRIDTDYLAELEDVQKLNVALFKGGENTRTDVAQADAEVASARGQLAAAKAQFQSNRAAYAVAVGRNPGELAPLPRLAGMPATVDQAFDLVEAQSPDILQAKHTEAASWEGVREAEAAFRPSVTAIATYGFSGPALPYAQREFDRAVAGQVQLSVPLFTGGLLASHVRQAKEQNNSDRTNIEYTRRVAIQSVAQAWNQILASRAQAAAEHDDVTAGTAAVTGAREEYKGGERSSLDLLFAQERLLTARLAVETAQETQYVAEATVLSLVGRLEARQLLVDVPAYDPVKSFNHVKNSGAMPWDRVVAAVDSIGSPGEGRARFMPASLKADATPKLQAPSAAADPQRPAMNLPIATSPPDSQPIPAPVLRGR